MPKLKLKKNVQKILFISLFVIIVLIIGINVIKSNKKQKEYEQTYEYKLKNIGYNDDDIKTITSKYKNKEIDYILENKKDDVYLLLIKEKYFIYDKFYDYLNYIKSNPSLSFTKVVEKVNTKTNKDYYEDPIKTDTSKNYLMLVNKYYYLDKDYNPELVTVPLTYAYGTLGSQKVTKDTYDAFLSMWKSANEAGYKLIINSSYRTYEEQEKLYNSYLKEGIDVADSKASRPGYSEHQTGYVVDITCNGASNKTFHETETYTWLLDNAYKFGFILRYPQDKVDITGNSYESWHYRYVGVDASTYIHDNNITFEEYYAYFVETH